MKLILANIKEIHKGDIVYFFAIGARTPYRMEVSEEPFYDEEYKCIYLSTRAWCYAHPIDQIKFPLIYVNPLEENKVLYKIIYINVNWKKEYPCEVISERYFKSTKNVNSWFISKVSHVHGNQIKVNDDSEIGFHFETTDGGVYTLVKE